MTAKLQRNLWILVVPVLLLAMVLAVHRLSGYPFDDDEWVNLRLAGGISEGRPLPLAEVWARVTEDDPDQTYGLALVYSVWGRIFGWSEFAARILPLFAGILTLAWAYRAGSDWFAPLVGLVAAMLLSTSVLFIVFLHLARAFSLVMLFALMTVWSYWRLTLHPSASGKDYPAQLGLLAGSIGIIYTHYYAILLLVGLCLWHLLFLPKDRRWWRPVWLFGLAGIAFLPQLEGFLSGVRKTQTAPWHNAGDAMLRATEILPWFLHVFTNGILRLPMLRLPMVLNITILILLIPIVAIFWRRNQQREWFHQIQFLLFSTLLVLFLMLFVNEIILVMRPNRLRYMIALWPLCTLLVGWGIWKTRGHWRMITAFCMGAYVVFGIWANTIGELRYEFYTLLGRYTVRPFSSQIVAHASQSDLLLIGAQQYQIAHGSGYFLARFPERQLVLEDAPESRQEFLQAAEEHLRIMLLAAGEVEGVEHRGMVAQLPSGMVFCERIIDHEDLVLELYGWSRTFCPNDEPAQMRFGEDIDLAASEVEVVARDTLRIDLLMHSEENIAMTGYSVAIHVFAVDSGDKVAQGDQGLWLGRYNPVRSEIDISTLTPGEYEVKIGLYNWQTFERLPGVDLASGARADLLTLIRFRVE